MLSKYNQGGKDDHCIFFNNSNTPVSTQTNPFKGKAIPTPNTST
ncbi:hypothetical protein ACTJJ0_12640 [Chitinophaga sp. 22321]|nr:hypothetical protein [Chitinophaga hostae]